MRLSSLVLLVALAGAFALIRIQQTPPSLPEPCSEHSKDIVNHRPPSKQR